MAKIKNSIQHPQLPRPAGTGAGTYGPRQAGAFGSAVSQKKAVSTQLNRQTPRNPSETNSPHAPDTPMPVKTHVYRTIAELNGGFEKVLNDLKTLGQVSFFRSLSANSLHCQLSRIRAQVNREFALTLHEREMANAGYFERLCDQSESAGDDSKGAKA